jgi:hypothetical protein
VECDGRTGLVLERLHGSDMLAAAARPAVAHPKASPCAGRITPGRAQRAGATGSS